MRRTRRSRQQVSAVTPAPVDRAWYVQPTPGTRAVVHAPRAADVAPAKVA